ncbi:lytic murein transglycosylase [Actinokineospora sp. NBRC 105648]|uniref:lytic murein transglycosylase n=1 Tax=Actinokineospora sp. NBRC 105648 TaxID=3032206 RepID=UPI0024A5E306|nr:lytic murein transglycosylase [Actinokineospora sp. NBRC 105648]GLZ39098.1 hypothetical protein Acsp05_27220 [Actinokineospora sp. NBRC 105648]
MATPRNRTVLGTGGVRPVTALALVLLSMAASAAYTPTSAQPPPAAAAVVVAPTSGPVAGTRAGSTTSPVLNTFTAVGPIAQLAPLPAAAPPTAERAGVPENVLAAYERAEKALAASQPGCGLRWYHLAGIGKIESGHARGGRADERGDTAPRIIGLELSGAGVAAIPDTDGGALDADTDWDRAVGPMQFIPSTWRRYATDGNGDGVASPHNIFDAARAAGDYLCSGGLNLADPAGLRAAVFRYNNSDAYVASVLTWMFTYSNGATPTPPAPPGAEEPPPVVVHPVEPPEPFPLPEPTEEAKPVPSTVPLPTEPAPTEPTVPTDPSVPAEPPTEPSVPVEPTPSVPPADPAAVAECGLVIDVPGAVGPVPLDLCPEPGADEGTGL